MHAPGDSDERLARLLLVAALVLLAFSLLVGAWLWTRPLPPFQDLPGQRAERLTGTAAE